MIKEINFTFQELKEMGMLKGTCNVGIRSEQLLEIKRMIINGKYQSINQFVQEAVEEKITALNRRK